MEVETQDAGQAGGEQAGGGEQTGGFDSSALQPLQQHIERLGQTVESRFGELEQRLPQPEQQEDPYARNDLGQFAPPEQPGQMPGMPAGPIDPGQMYDEYGDLTPQGTQALLQQAVAPLAQQFQAQTQQLQQQVQQQQEMLREFQMDRGAERLESKFPELKDQQAADALVAAASQYGRPDLVGEDWFLELVHTAQRAQTQAAGETPATPSPQLEPASGASLAGGEPDPRQGILGAGRTNRVWGV